MKVRLWKWVGLSFVSSLLVSACGGSDDGHPDTGYGKSQPVPEISCAALCEREGDCLVHLCNEDTASDRYTGLGSLVESQCKATCTESQVQAHAKEWPCLFES